MARYLTALGTLCATLLVPGVVLAGEGHPNIPGAQLSVLWANPFVCMASRCFFSAADSSSAETEPS